MYERSAIVLEKYFDTLIGLDQKINLQTIYQEYQDLVKITDEYKILMDADLKLEKIL